MLTIVDCRRREGRDFDFGFNIPSLPPPVAKAPSPSEPPFRPPAASQPELTAQLSSGSSNGRGRGRPRSLPKDAPPKAAVNNANTSAKRRKSRSEGPPGLAEQQVSSRTTRSSPNAQVDIYAIPEDLDADPVLQLQNDLNNSIQEQGDAILEEPTEVIVGEQVELSIEEQADAKIESGQELEAVLPEPAQAKEATPVAAQGGDEVTESPADAPGSGHRKRIGLNTSALHSTRLQDVVQIEGPTDVAELEASAAKERKRKRGKTSQPPTKRSRRSLSKDEASAVPSDLEKFPPATRTLRGLSVAGNEIAETNGLEESVLRFALEDDIDDPSPQPRVRRSKRSSSKNESVAPEADADVAMDIEEDAEAEDDVPVAIEGEAEEAEEIGDEEASSILKKNRGRRVSRNAPRAGSPDLDEPAEELSQPKRKKARKAQVTPAKQSQPKKAASRKEKAGSKAEKESSRGKPLSIAVHRMSQRPTYDDDVPDAHILNSDIPYIKRPGVNTIDMLSQIAWDTTNSAIEQLDSGIQNTEDKNLKKEYKTKRSAIYAFSSELQSRLAEHVSSSLLHQHRYVFLTHTDHQPRQHLRPHPASPIRNPCKALPP